MDAQVPQSAQSVLRDIIQRKPKVVLLNKNDMADPAQTNRWIAFITRPWEEKAIPIETKTGKGISQVYPAVREVLKEQIQAWERKVW